MSRPDPTRRARAQTLDAADPLARWRDEFVIPDPALVYLDGNSLGRMPKRTLARLERVLDRGVGRRPDPLVGRVARAAARGRRSAGAAPGRPRRRGARARLDLGEPLPARARGARAAPRPAGAGGRRARVPDRSLRGRRHRRGDRPRCAPRLRPARRRGGRRALGGRLPHRGALRSRRRNGAGERRRRARRLGPVARRGGARARARRGGSRARRRLHLQVPQRRPRRASLLLRRAGAAAGDRPADPGVVRPARPVRDGPALRTARGRRHAC